MGSHDQSNDSESLDDLSIEPTHQNTLDGLTSFLLETVTHELSNKGLCGSHVKTFYDGTGFASMPFASQVGGVLDKLESSCELSQDTRNLLYSHFPRNLGTNFRFKVGELAYIKWHDELCVVVINFVSQKLVACCDGAFDDGGDDCASTSTSNDGNNQSNVEATTCTSSYKVLDTAKIPGLRRSVWLHDINEYLFVDIDSHGLYSRLNALKPIKLSFSGEGDYDYDFEDEHNVEYDFDTETKRMIVRHYFVPIYFVTFPGYKKRCAKTFRFWVKEKDLIKYSSVVWHPKSTQKPEISPALDAVASPIDMAWAARTVDNINEHVYAVVHNHYYNNIVSGRYSNIMAAFHDMKLPWNVPSRLRHLVSIQQQKIMQIVSDDMITCLNRTHGVFGDAPLVERLSAYSIIQNFKYCLLLIGNLMKRTLDLVATLKNPEDNTFDTVIHDVEEEYCSDVELDEMCIPSLRYLGHLETALDGSLTYQQYFDNYINNFYWLDFYLMWLDANFLEYCCFNQHEYQYLTEQARILNRPLSKILNLQHISRLFCYDSFHSTCLSRIQKGGKEFMAYLPITQLLLQYMALIADDYCNNQQYGIDIVNEDSIANNSKPCDDFYI